MSKKGVDWSAEIKEAGFGSSSVFSAFLASAEDRDDGGDDDES